MKMHFKPLKIVNIIGLHEKSIKHNESNVARIYPTSSLVARLHTLINVATWQ